VRIIDKSEEIGYQSLLYLNDEGVKDARYVGTSGSITAVGVVNRRALSAVGEDAGQPASPLPPDREKTDGKTKGRVSRGNPETDLRRV
jgi:hypothetical protein